MNDDELWIPTVDVCALCGDSECDGVGCYANLDPNDERDHPRIEQVQDWVRRGRAWEQVDRVLAEAEGRPEVSPATAGGSAPLARTQRPLSTSGAITSWRPTVTDEWVWCCEDCGKPWPLPGDPPIFAECDDCGGPLNAARPEENPDV